MSRFNREMTPDQLRALNAAIKVVEGPKLKLYEEIAAHHREVWRKFFGVTASPQSRRLAFPEHPWFHG